MAWTSKLPPISGGSSARDQFAPGDRVWNIPALEEPSIDGDAATRAADWLESLRPLMSDLTPLSGLWWSRVLEEAQACYERWCKSSAVSRALIRPQMSEELQQIRYVRLESRAYAMLQAAVPPSVKEELIASRSLHCVGLLYHVLRLYQPGGLQERTRLLDQLSSPGKASSSMEGVTKLRNWFRALARGMTMGVSIPDSSIMLRGLDVLSEGILAKNPQVGFRCSTARNELHLDHQPTLANVREYAKILQSEFEMLAVSGADASASTPKKPPKVAKAATETPPKEQPHTAQTDPNPPNPNATPKHAQERARQKGDKGKQKGDSKGSGKGKGSCKWYLTNEGCKLWRTCRAQHDTQKAQEENRCFACGAIGHRQDQCPRPKGDNSPLTCPLKLPQLPLQAPKQSRVTLGGSPWHHLQLQ